MQKQQAWSTNVKDPTLLIDLLLHAGEELNAVDVMGQNGMHLRLIEKAREMNKAETEVLGRIAFWLAKVDDSRMKKKKRRRRRGGGGGGRETGEAEKKQDKIARGKLR